MLYPYKTLDDDTEIVHSEMSADGKVRVCIERPVEGGFHSATCELPSYKWSDVQGFSDEDIRLFTSIIESGAQSILEHARRPDAIQESRYLNSFPGLADSIIEGMNTPVSKCATELKW